MVMSRIVLLCLQVVLVTQRAFLESVCLEVSRCFDISNLGQVLAPFCVAFFPSFHIAISFDTYFGRLSTS